MSLFDQAFKLLTLNYSVLPSGGGDTGKAPLVDWAEFQARTPTDEELQSWQKRFNPKLWGIVTGAISGLVVVDADTIEARRALEQEIGSPHVITPRGGCHYYFKFPEHSVKTVAGILPGVDIRADGGFVNIIGSNPKGGSYQVLSLPTPDTLLPWSSLPDRIRVALNGARPLLQTEPEIGYMVEGHRNSMLTSLAGAMRRRGSGQAAIEAALRAENDTRCQPPLPDKEILVIIKSILKYDPLSTTVLIRDNVTIRGGEGSSSLLQQNKSSEAKSDTKTDILSDTKTEIGTEGGQIVDTKSDTSFAEVIRRWVEGTSGWWNIDELDRELGIKETGDKDYRGKVLRRLRDEGKVQQHQRINKQWRRIAVEIAVLNFKTARKGAVLPLKWVFGIERYVDLFPGNLVVVAGSPNAGKTALLLDFIYRNQNTCGYPIYLFSSEGGAEELRNRLEGFPDIAINDWSFEAMERMGDFADVIVPDCINIIDFLELPGDELWAVGTLLKAISKGLGNGLAIVAIQKKRGALLGRGQELGEEACRLYLSMDKGKLLIKKGKSWARKNVDPNGRTIRFTIENGCLFHPIGGWEAEETYQG